jgi:ethanolamine utilization protein EutN
MRLAQIVGHATATMKYPGLKSWRLLIAQPLDIDGQADGEPMLVLDNLGAGGGDRVLISSDGRGARQLVGDPRSPARWFVQAICDPK